METHRLIHHRVTTEIKPLPSHEPAFKGHDGGSYAASRDNPTRRHLGNECPRSRNVIGHAPGMPNYAQNAAQVLPGMAWDGKGYRKPGHGETVKDLLIVSIQMSAAHDEGRCEPDPITPTNPIPGSEWGFNPKEADEAVDHVADTLIATEIVDSESPRKQGFNYGVGWGPSEKPSVYFDGVRIGNALNDIAHDASKRAWAMTIALRNVRLAETDTEKARSVAELSKLVADYMSEDDIDLRIRLLVNDLSDIIEEKAPSNPKGYVPHMGIHYAMAPIKAIVAKIKAALA